MGSFRKTPNRCHALTHRGFAAMGVGMYACVHDDGPKPEYSGFVLSLGRSTSSRQAHGKLAGLARDCTAVIVAIIGFGPDAHLDGSSVSQAPALSHDVAFRSCSLPNSE